MTITILGRTMNMEALKQPRGFLRCIQFCFALLAFCFCSGFGSYLGFGISCNPDINNTTLPGRAVRLDYSYPFQLDHADAQNFTVCGEKASVTFPGDFSSDAQFYVFIGVLCWLYCIGTLYIYTFLGDTYEEGQKNLPLYDFVVSAAFAFFWLASASAWAHGLSGLKDASDPSTWIFQNGEGALAPICSKAANGGQVNQAIKSCEVVYTGNFAGGNISVVIGFLNVFLWSANLWFLYKETRWATPNTGNLQNVESPTGSI